MNRPYNISQVDESLFFLRNLSIKELNSAISEFPSLTKAVILHELEMFVLSKSFSDLSMEELGNDFFTEIVPFLTNENISFFIDNSILNYMNMRTHEVESIRIIASEKIAPMLSLSLDNSEKLRVIESLIGEKITANYDSDFVLKNLPSALVLELNLVIIITDPRVELAIKHSNDFNLIANISNNQVVWKLSTKELKKEEDFWNKFKNKVNNFTKNTIRNPSFRKYAAVCVVVGIAIVSEDASAKAGDIDLDQVKEFFSQFDDYFNDNTLSNSNFNEHCTVSTEIIESSPTNLSTKISIGDRFLVIDVKSANSASKGFSFAETNVRLKVIKREGIVTACDMGKEAYIKLGQIITKQLSGMK